MSEQSPRVERATGLQINPPVFFISAGLIIAFSIYGALFSEQASAVFGEVQSWLVHQFGWLYMSSVAVFFIFVLALALSRFADIKLGPDDSEPDYSYTSWFAMLFSAGMGIGLMFFGVAEPVMHFASPPVGEGGTVEAAREAMRITFFHWGLHAWAIYIVVGLSLAYFSFRHGLPLTIRSALYPIIGERIYGPIGHAVDIFAVLGTMFGVATSLGLGVMQVNAGLNYLFDVPDTTGVQVVLIGIITLMATASVVSGLDAGIRRISELNLLLALTLVVFMLVAGPTVVLMTSLVQNVGMYLSSIVDMTFKLYAYEPTEWIGNWTLFYWAWWIAWSPFVGMFIARVSRGRTIRQFVVGVLFVPAGFTFVWLSFFGNTALHRALSETGGGIADAVAANINTALFVLLEQMPWAGLTSLIATILVITFFVTSSDSGSLVIDMITSGGTEEPPTWQRVFWALSEGVVAAVLLLAGGLKALQTASITSALPFVVVILVVCYGLWKGLRMEGARRMHPTPAPAVPAVMTGGSWRQRLNALLKHHERPEVERFLQDVVKPAVEGVAEEIRGRDMEVDVEAQEDRVRLLAHHGPQKEFLYEVRMRCYRSVSFAYPEWATRPDRQRGYCRAEVYLLEGAQHYDVMGYSREALIADLLTQYEKHMHFLHLNG